MSLDQAGRSACATVAIMCLLLATATAAVVDRIAVAVDNRAIKESQIDRDLTQQIRKAIMADKSLSTTAKNVKIITVNGAVTLRGPVKSLHEKEAIEAKAQQIAGATNVENQLEVARRSPHTP